MHPADPRGQNATQVCSCILAHVWSAAIGEASLCSSLTLSSADHPNFLDHANSIFKSAACYCHLVRHPHSCIASGLELRRDICMNPQVSWEEVESAYVRLQVNVHTFLEDRSSHDFRSLRICYEDLLRHPASTLAGVCKLVGLEFEDGMETPYESENAVSSFKAGSLIATTDPKL